MKAVELALKYAKMGIAVFPCHVGSKSPAIRGGGGFKDATTDEKLIRKWWGRFPNALIGSPNNFFTVIDVDIHGLCDGGRMLTENALDRLLDEVCLEDTMVVNTKSGGYHIYFNKHPTATRRIKMLPNIDILGEGGYVILPDQKYYTTVDDPFTALNTLADLDLPALEKLAEDMVGATALAIQLKKEQKSSKEISENKPSKPRVATKKAKVKDASVVPDLRSFMASDKIDAVDYKTGEIKFEQDKDMYKTAPILGTEYDGCQKILNKDGKIKVEPNTVDSDMIASWFYNREIQAKLCKFLGVKVPSINTTTIQRSVLPGHIDRNPSMGARWNQKGTHILIRDFSNFFGCPYGQVDYNVVRLYATLNYKALAPRLSPAEFVVWFLRLLVEADILEVADLRKRYLMPMQYSSQVAAMAVARGIQYLDAIKQLYKGYDGTTTFSDRFAAAWCGITPSSANRGKSYLVHRSYLFVVGVYDCGMGKRDDGFYNTNVFAIIHRPMKKKPVVNKESKREKEMKANAICINGIKASASTYDRIVALCKDMEFEQCTPREYMFVETGVYRGIRKVLKDGPPTTVVMKELYVEIVDGGLSGETLMLLGESKDVEDVFYERMKVVRKEFSPQMVMSDEPLLGFPIAHSEEGFGELDLEFLEAKVREYLEDMVVFDENVFILTTEDDYYDYIIDGLEPEAD